MHFKTANVLRLCLLLAPAALILTGCVPGDGANSAADPAGLFTGIWHGWIAPFSLISSFFNPNLSIYENFNTGLSYDFGFYIAIISGFGGLSLIRNKNRHR